MTVQVICSPSDVALHHCLIIFKPDNVNYMYMYTTTYWYSELHVASSFAKLFLQIFQFHFHFRLSEYQSHMFYNFPARKQHLIFGQYRVFKNLNKPEHTNTVIMATYPGKLQLAVSLPRFSVSIYS